MIFSNAAIAMAGLSDLPVIEQLLNAAYRGDASRKGWTSEADLITGETRATAAQLMEVLQRPGSVFLKYTPENGVPCACVNLQQQHDRLYLGMLAVNPGLQGAGMGKQLIRAAEEYAVATGCTTVYMTVIDERPELVNWYKRQDYKETGEKKFFQEDGITGTHLQPLHLITLEKKIPV